MEKPTINKDYLTGYAEGVAKTREVVEEAFIEKATDTFCEIRRFACQHRGKMIAEYICMKCDKFREQICADCSIKEKCKRTKNCKSNELAINVKKAMIDMVCELMIAMLNDGTIQTKDIGYVNTKIRKTLQYKIK